jgi:hypothetical protein
MRPDSSSAESPVALASGPVAGAGAGAAQGDAAVTLPGLGAITDGFTFPMPRVATRPWAGRLALGSLLVAAFVLALFSSAQETVLVPHSYLTFPRWEAGPLHHLFGSLFRNQKVLNPGFSALLVLTMIPYGVALAAVRTMSLRMIVAFVITVQLILLMSPPLQLTDLWNYLGYARLGALHGLNPYTHVMLAESHDPVFRFTSWHNLSSPYGPLFTALSYPLGWMPLPVAYWVMKIVTVLMSLTFVGLVGLCARQLGRDPRFAILFVAANPIFLFYAVGGFHNDFFMLVPSMAAISLMLARRDRAAGAAVMLAVAIKFTAILLLPFLIIGVRTNRRRIRIVSGAGLATIPLVAMWLILFGLAIPNLADQSSLLTDFSIPNVVGGLLGLGGGTPELLRLTNVLLVVVVAYIIWRRDRDWLASAGWATVALLASLAWLIPWYIIWVLPLAALGTSLRLRRVAIIFTLYLILTFAPETGFFLTSHGINPMAGSAGQASTARQNHLADGLSSD